MANDSQERTVEIDLGYELYQIIKDFTNPIEILREAFQNSVDEGATEVWCDVKIEQRLGAEDLVIDIWDNGAGLREEHVPCFFGLAKSTKVTPNRMPTGKQGYKGHGTKVYFNAERIEICSKPNSSVAAWGIVLEDPIKQIRELGTFSYSPPIDAKDCSIALPNDFETGFFLRIKNPYHFKTQHTRYMLNHLYLRDYAKWYTVFGTIRPLFRKNTINSQLYLRGLGIDHFQSNYSDFSEIDPIPEFTLKNSQTFERIEAGHYFPTQRKDDKSMKTYAKKVGSDKPYYDYYSREVIKERIHLNNNIHFDFMLNTEGYETKRRYDVLLTRRARTSLDKHLQHIDGERYGLWACKGGVPIEKVDDWIAGGRGIGAYTYMHAFVDCDAFELTANRGSIRNTDLEIIDQVKTKINEILSNRSVQAALSEREMWEEFEKKQRSIDEDASELKNRFGSSKNRRHIVFPDGSRVQEPAKTKGGYSESETFMVLIQLLSRYPRLFPFTILDYNTTKGIDFVVEKGHFPKYIELKGTFQKKVNHSFRNIYKFICYDIDMENGEVVTDIEPLNTTLRINKDDHFESSDECFNNKTYTSYQLDPESAIIQSMEIIVLKHLLNEVIGATFG